MHDACVALQICSKMAMSPPAVCWVSEHRAVMCCAVDPIHSPPFSKCCALR
uniref:Uncharacterized protein n=1 Tax=Anguilla anguilla TaxID=7936 RepID=A0A0E9XQ59_ANGAN